MVIGGGQLYAAALPAADRMLLTLVDCAPEADTWFPDWDEADWRAADVRDEAADANNPFAYRVVDLRRRSEVAG
jgi:dihydrofolate reductase